MKEKNQTNALRWIWTVTGKYKGGVGVLLVIQTIFGLCSVVSAVLLMNLIDAAVAGSRTGFFAAALRLAALYLFQEILRVFSRFLREWTSASLENRLKQRLFANLLQKDYASVTAVHSGQWITRLTSDVSVVTGGVMSILPSLGGMAARLAGALAALLILQPAFFYILVPAGILMLVTTALLRKVLKRMHKQIQEASGAVLSFLQERLESMMVVRVFSQQEQTCQGAAEKMKVHKSARMKRSNFSNLCNLGFGLIVDCSYLLGAVYCGYGILQGTLSYGAFTAVLQLVGQVQSPFAMISGLVPQYFAMTASAERLMEAEAYPGEEDQKPIPDAEVRRFYEQKFTALGGRGAMFSYRRKDAQGAETSTLRVIDHLDFEIRKGEYVAFTGRSGSGKSTLFKLLMCLYPLDEGELYLRAGQTEQPLTAAWRGLFAYVPQGNQLMSGSIREVVTFGDPDGMRQEDRIRLALRIACAEEFVYHLDQGIDTLLGERGAGLSEGQMQRIAIARAIFSDRPILILDEATSALDEATEKQLLDNLRQMTRKTVLIITHRPAALEICNRVIAVTEENETAETQQREKA